MGFMFILVFLMLNVGSSAAALPIDAMPGFFRLGYGMPFMNLVQASKSILVGSNEVDLSRCIGVHFAWIAGVAVLLWMEYTDAPLRLKEWCFAIKAGRREDAFAKEVRYQLFPDQEAVLANKVMNVTRTPFISFF